MNEYDSELFDSIKDDPFSKELFIEDSLARYGMEYNFEDFTQEKDSIQYGDVEAYHEELMLLGYIEELCNRISDEIFYLLFNNRNLLLRFNLALKRFVSDLQMDGINNPEAKELFLKDGVLKRVNIPSWCKKAVFFRDRGHCCGCGKDVSGLLSLSEYHHFDHIVPLALGGVNDISNLQLLCQECNLEKGGKYIYTSNKYEKWY